MRPMIFGLLLLHCALIGQNFPKNSDEKATTEEIPNHKTTSESSAKIVYDDVSKSSSTTANIDHESQIAYIETQNISNPETSIPSTHPIYHKPNSSRWIRFGLSTGTQLPYHSLYQDLNYAYQVGPCLALVLNPRSSILLDIMVSVANRFEQKGKSEAINERSVLNVNALLRHGVYRAIFMDLGVGIYIPKLSLTASSYERKIESLEYYYGVCSGLAICMIQSGSVSLFFNPRYHTYYSKNKLVDNLSLGISLIY